ncbi:MAG: GFA family protein [Bdellovibrionales bacterium]|nr:GFA family protein [Bdellovibrionales bacterium]
MSFEVHGDFENFFLCHCKHCQKDTGSAFAANLFSTTASLNWKSGENLVKAFNLPNTRHVKSFCSDCGSAVPNIQMGGKLLVVPAGSIDNNVSIKPEAHIFISSKAEWENDLDSLVKFEGLPT